MPRVVCNKNNILKIVMVCVLFHSHSHIPADILSIAPGKKERKMPSGKDQNTTQGRMCQTGWEVKASPPFRKRADGAEVRGANCQTHGSCSLAPLWTEILAGGGARL